MDPILKSVMILSGAFALVGCEALLDVLDMLPKSSRVAPDYWDYDAEFERKAITLKRICIPVETKTPF